MIYRNEMTFANESEYNDWAISETELIITNTENKYNELINAKNDKHIYILVKYTMLENNIKIKIKNIKATIELLKDYLEDYNSYNA